MQNSTLAIAASLIAGLVLGYFGNAIIGGTGSAEQIAQNLQESGYPAFDVSEQQNADGTITEASNGNIRVELSNPALAKAIRGQNDIRTVDVGSAEIVREVELSAEEQAAEEARFEQELAAQGDNPEDVVEPPQFFREESITAADLQAGMNVSFETNEQIGTKRQLTATRVVVSAFQAEEQEAL